MKKPSSPRSGRQNAVAHNGNLSPVSRARRQGGIVYPGFRGAPPWAIIYRLLRRLGLTQPKNWVTPISKDRCIYARAAIRLLCRREVQSIFRQGGRDMFSMRIGRNLARMALI